MELFKFVFGHNVSKNMDCCMKGKVSGNCNKCFIMIRLIMRKWFGNVRFVNTEIGSTPQENKD